MMNIQEQIDELRDKTAGAGIHFVLRDRAADTMERLANALAGVDLVTELPKSTVDLIYECRTAMKKAKSNTLKGKSYSKRC